MRPTISAALAVTVLIHSAICSYAPTATSCPSTHIVRAASGLSDQEQSFRVGRKVKADFALALWLKKTNPAFDVSCDLPTIALSSSGGGFRALLVGAGVVQGLDARDSFVSTSGLYQALTYHSALSGGSWLLSSIAAYDFTTISALKKMWKPAFANGLFDPLGFKVSTAFAEISKDLGEKEAAGFSGTVADAWSRLLSFQLLPGPNGGVSNTLSQIASRPRFLTQEAPYPIITAQHVDLSLPSCLPPANAPVWEFTPFEFGSWDSQISSFARTAYLGSPLSAGQPANKSCISNYDNLGFVLGTSSTLFNDPGIGTNSPDVPLQSTFCTIPPSGIPTANQILLSENLNNLLVNITTLQLRAPADLFATWPNPFYNLSTAPLVSAQKDLAMVDGGESGQVNPIFPFLLPERNVSVILVNDNDADTAAYYPDGTELHNSYVAAQAAGLTRMPFVPTSQVLLAQNLTQSPVFFGCNDTSTATVVWIPNAPLTAAGGGTETSQMQYAASQTDSMIANGVAVVSQNNSAEWATCLGCVIVEGTGRTLPAECTACFDRYCFRH